MPWSGLIFVHYAEYTGPVNTYPLILRKFHESLHNNILPSVFFLLSDEPLSLFLSFSYLSSLVFFLFFLILYLLKVLFSFAIYSFYEFGFL